jgi:hypothetical protein
MTCEEVDGSSKPTRQAYSASTTSRENNAVMASRPRRPHPIWAHARHHEEDALLQEPARRGVVLVHQAAQQALHKVLYLRGRCSRKCMLLDATC